MTPLLLILRQGQGLVPVAQDLVQPPLEQVRLAQPRNLHRAPDANRAHRGRRLHDFLQELPALLPATRERVGVAESSQDGPGLKLPRAGDAARALQHLDRRVEFTLRDRYAADTREGFGDGEWMLGLF